MNYKEGKTIALMIGLYHRKNHANKGVLCYECRSLLDYALHKLVKCPQQPIIGITHLINKQYGVSSPETA
jgi:hypothetical protein